MAIKVNIDNYKGLLIKNAYVSYLTHSVSKRIQTEMNVETGETNETKTYSCNVGYSVFVDEDEIEELYHSSISFSVDDPTDVDYNYIFTKLKDHFGGGVDVL
jgi:hypothetical protein